MTRMMIPLVKSILSLYRSISALGTQPLMGPAPGLHLMVLGRGLC